MLKLSSDEGPVVMVDDNGGDLFFVERCYLSSKVKNPWLAFARGQEFLEMLQSVKSGESPMPALVLLDLNMPGMTGLEILQETRADPYFGTLPIFCVLTSSTDPRDQRRAQELGVTGFYTKSSSIDHYIEFFNSMLK
jgi:CheY-like chemotaxis protein